MKEEPMTALAGSRQSLESPLPGNWHGGFGGGGEETQFGCASCPYLTGNLHVRFGRGGEGYTAWLCALPLPYTWHLLPKHPIHQDP